MKGWIREFFFDSNCLGPRLTILIITFSFELIKPKVNDFQRKYFLNHDGFLFSHFIVSAASGGISVKNVSSATWIFKWFNILIGVHMLICQWNHKSNGDIYYTLYIYRDWVHFIRNPPQALSAEWMNNPTEFFIIVTLTISETQQNLYFFLFASITEEFCEKKKETTMTSISFIHKKTRQRKKKKRKAIEEKSNKTNVASQMNSWHLTWCTNQCENNMYSCCVAICGTVTTVCVYAMITQQQ